MLSAIYLVAGMAMLLLGGDLLVRGSTGLALRLGIAPMVVGLTIVAMGTSAPEMFVSVGSALNGAGGIAIGNVVGSNIANILLVLALPALVVATNSHEPGIGRSIVVMLAVTLVYMAMLSFGAIGRVSGLVLVAILLFYVRDQLVTAGGNPPEAPTTAAADKQPRWLSIFLIVAGLVLLPLGAQLTVDGATTIARHVGVSEALIGLTIIAVGTSLPELATSMLAVLRGTNSVALGNVVGSNIFNITGIMGVSALTSPMAVPERTITLDMWVMLAAAVALGAMSWFRRQIGAVTATIMIAAYSGFVVLSLYL